METEMEGERSTMELQALPEGCIANILSHTTPVDACRLSLLCKPFCSAAESDTVWDRFIPTDFLSIVSTSQSVSSLLTTSPSKKSLYLTLSDHPIVVESGTEVTTTLTLFKSSKKKKREANVKYYNKQKEREKMLNIQY